MRWLSHRGGALDYQREQTLKSQLTLAFAFTLPPLD
jgi:3-polyprenyl-4-hydroxybenzoate decarboxylase